MMAKENNLRQLVNYIKKVLKKVLTLYAMRVIIKTVKRDTGKQ